jgi:hemerythrin HHE cation binding domain-containing protein
MAVHDSDRLTAPTRPPRTVGGVDFSLMHAAHDAFTRDLARLAGAAAAGRAGQPSVRAGWATFSRQLSVHHTAEDTALWPALRAKVTKPTEIAVLDDMVAEHAQIDPQLAQIDRALADAAAAPAAAARAAAAPGTAAPGAADSLAASAGDLERLLTAHLRHEEEKALPLVAAYLGAKGWAAFGRAVARLHGLSGAAEFFPWMLEGTDPATSKHLLALLPLPVRFIHRAVWAPRYARTSRW